MSGAEEPLSRKKRVGVIGGKAPDETVLENARRLGELIAAHGYILVNGGMGGVMEASARGARQCGGVVIAILPGLLRAEGNPYSDIVIPTGLGYLRNPLVVLNSDIIAAIDGEYGTLSEIAYAKIYGRTVFGIGSWDVNGVIPCASPEDAMKKIDAYFSSLSADD